MSTFPLSKALRSQLASAGILNPHDLAKNGTPFIAYRPADNTGITRRAGIQIVRPGYRTDPAGTWRDNWYKTFAFQWRDEKPAALAAAQEHYEKRYGKVDEWVRLVFAGESWWPRPLLAERIALALGEVSEASATN